MKIGTHYSMYALLFAAGFEVTSVKWISCYPDYFSNSEPFVVGQEGAGHQVASAFVEIVFDNSDNRIPVITPFPYYLHRLFSANILSTQGWKTVLVTKLVYI